MSEYFTKIIERLECYIDLKGYKFNQLATAIGMSNSYFSKMVRNKGSLGEDVIKKILLFYDDINPIWFLFGDGEMLKLKNEDASDQRKVTDLSSVLPHKSPLYEHSGISAYVASESDRQYISKDLISISIVDMSVFVSSGYLNPDHLVILGSLYFPANLLQYGQGRYYCGRIHGESMAPTLLNRDFILFRLLGVDEWLSVDDSNVYLIIDRTGSSCVRRLKNLLKEEDMMLCMSDSMDKSSFRDFKMHRSDIAYIYHVEWRFSKDMANSSQTYSSRVEMLEKQVRNIQEMIRNKFE